MSSLLDTINQPADLQDLTREQLTQLAAEVRQRILDTVSCTGGHLAPNLGVVELTIALHRSFDSPQDKLIWDVGHQCYTHKLLTGRQEGFEHIRHDGGPSGFPRRDESEHDAWGAGHGSTSVSAALGFAVARDLRGGDEHVVAVIGDGALTGGMAFEALNQAGQQQVDMLVVLNDNEMSIGRSVGAVATYLSRVRAGVEPAVRRFRRDLERLLRPMPGGDAMVLFADRVREGMKELVVPGMLFEHLGITYLGPIDGHDMTALLAMLEQAKRLPGPVLLHVLTTKGKGYDPAECDPQAFHGTAPFDLDNGAGEPTEGPPTYSQVFGQALSELAEQDSRIVAISAAMVAGTGLQAFRKLFPDRCFDVGMAEEHAVTFAGGMAAAGLRPVVAIYSTFLQRAYDQIIHDVCLQGLPVVFALDRAGLVGDDGPTHHGVFDLSYLRSIPGLTVIAPADERELRDMLRTALSLGAPVALRYPRGQGVGADTSGAMQVLPVGRGRVLREGDALTILSIGTMLAPALEVAELLAAEGLAVGVVDARFAKPLDEELILQRAALGPIVTVEENALAGGFGAGVMELLQDRGVCSHRVRRLGIPDRFISHGGKSRLWAELGLDAAGITAAARSLAADA
ncbi:MAG: 1-deoxy-D-xylulose-5-phosphate synthase [Armatimonadetes bacterium]|nr:1-deoxy-D-xylulose-5-phosphate synthase [Armatimonadota bacterium]